MPLTNRMQATARCSSVFISIFPPRRRLIRDVRPIRTAMTESCVTTLSSGLFVFFTIVVLAASWTAPVLGFHYAFEPAFAFEQPFDFRDRLLGILLLSPCLAMLLLLSGLVPAIRGRLLCGIGLTGGLLLLPSVAAYAWKTGFPFGAALFFLAVVYFGSWWFLVRLKLPMSHSQSHESKIP
jgi:hypothetical protein